MHGERHHLVGFFFKQRAQPDQVLQTPERQPVRARNQADQFILFSVRAQRWTKPAKALFSLLRRQLSASLGDGLTVILLQLQVVQFAHGHSW